MNSDYLHYVHVGIHVLVVLLLPPFLRGVINRVKANFGGRVGPPIWQPYYDLIKLFQKGFVISNTTSGIFVWGTVVVFVATFLAAMIVPFGWTDAPFSFGGDMILFAYLLGLSRLFLVLTALDTGSPFEGMGVAREISFACLTEPALFFGLLVTAFLSKSAQMGTMLNEKMMSEWEVGASSLLLVIVSWFIVMLAENSRIPFDDPNTHLELTMIHEVIILDHSGPLLGLMLYAAEIKLLMFAALVVRIAVPLTSDPWLNWGIFFLAVCAVAALIGVVESIMARLRMPEVPKLLATACVLAGLAFLLVVRVTI
ncbi:MAG: NADH-quinone oxidoreductase subunit H [Planctomycetes bacterium]|nr:NADH-quinone oxidoreductase subunit H [Planctomycetota bacterium]